MRRTPRSPTADPEFTPFVRIGCFRCPPLHALQNRVCFLSNGCSVRLRDALRCASTLLWAKSRWRGRTARFITPSVPFA